MTDRIRQFELTVTYPFVSHDAITSLWYTASEAIGKLDDHLGDTLGLDERSWYRGVGPLLSLTLQLIPNFYAHEMGHTVPYINYTAHGAWRWTDIRPYYEPWPDDPFKKYTNDNPLRTVGAGAGINQQEFNLMRLQDKMISGNRIAPDVATNYLGTKLFELGYLYFAAIMNVTNENNRTCAPGRDAWDHSDYRCALQQRGIESSPVVFYALPALFAAASGGFISSAAALTEYIATGNRDAEPLHIDSGALRRYLPEFRMLLHPDGPFIHVEFPFRTQSELLPYGTWEVGASASTGFQAYRIGGRIHRLRLGSHWGIPQLTAGAFLTIRPDHHVPIGALIEAGMTVAFPFGMRVGISGALSYQDPIATDIKRQGIDRSGVRFSGSDGPAFTGALLMGYDY